MRQHITYPMTSSKEGKDLQYFNGVHVGRMNVVQLAEGSTAFVFAGLE